MRRTGVVVSGGDRIGVPPLALTLGGTTNTVTVAAEAPLVQSQSGERSFAVTTTQIEALPIARGNFTNLIAFTPGVRDGGFNQNGARLGGASQDNLMMDGISAVDTGNNGQMVNMNIESIGEVKILTQGYQAEYGRSSGLQITAFTKSGTNLFHGSGYSVFTDSDWNKNSWVGAEERRREVEVEPANLRLYHWRPGGHPESLQRAQQTVLLLRARVRADDRADQQRQPYPVSSAVGTGARRQLLAEPRQQRQPASAR